MDTDCPHCRTRLTPTGYSTTPYWCVHCGFIPEDGSAEIDSALERSNMKFVIGFSVVLVTGFLQVASWGDFALEMRWLQLADVAGMASVKNFDRMAEICAELKKRDCVEYAYRRQSQMDRKHALRLAVFQMDRRKFADAARTLKTYVATTKHDARAYLLYAKVLTEIGQFDEAVRYYEYLLARAHTLPEEAAQNYVRCLARAKRFEQAQAVILKIRDSYPGTARFMEGELRVLAGLKSSELPPPTPTQGGVF